MAEIDIGSGLREKSLELREMLKGLKATIEQWKFSIEETKEGIRVELHAVALVKQTKEKKK